MHRTKRVAMSAMAMVVAGFLTGRAADAADAYLQEATVGDIAVGVDTVGVNVNKVTGCNVNGTPNANGTYVRFKLAGPEAKTWFALLLVAKETKKSISAWFDPALACQLTAIKML